MGSAYAPLSDRPIRDALQNPDFPAAALGRFSIVVSLLARGVSAGDWSLMLGDSTEAEKGVATLASSTREVRIFIVKDTAAAITLTVEGLVDEDDVNTFTVVADREPTRATRSPRARYGRVGTPRASRISIEDVMTRVGSADDLYETFRMAGGF